MGVKKTTETSATKPVAKTATKKPVTRAKKDVVKKPVAKKVTAKKSAVKKTATKKPVVKSDSFEPFILQLSQESTHLDPVIPKLPDLPEAPEPMEMGVCRHCNLLPAAAYELVIVMTCLVFSLSAVLLTSTQTIERQEQVIATLQEVGNQVYVRR